MDLSQSGVEVAHFICISSDPTLTKYLYNAREGLGCYLVHGVV